MILTVFILWVALGALAVFFVYCCSRVSNGSERDLRNDDLEERAPEPEALAVARQRLISRERGVPPHGRVFAKRALHHRSQ
jgi:hypothetical protein